MRGIAEGALGMNLSARQLVYPSNLLSLLRLLLTVPIVYLVARPRLDMDAVLLLLLGVATLTDFFDGYVSRKLAQQSELGKVLDPLADKVLMAGALIAIVICRGFPAWVVSLLIYRDVLIVALGAIVIRRSGQVTTANLLGKLNTTLFAIAFLLFLILPAHIATRLAIYSCAAITVISGVSYYASGERYLVRNRFAKFLLRLAVIAPLLALWALFR